MQTAPRRRGRPPLAEGAHKRDVSVGLPEELLERITRYGSLTLPQRPEWSEPGGPAPKRALLLRELIEKGLDTFDRAQKRRHKMTSTD